MIEKKKTTRKNALFNNKFYPWNVSIISIYKYFREVKDNLTKYKKVFFKQYLEFGIKKITMYSGHSSDKSLR